MVQSDPVLFPDIQVWSTDSILHVLFSALSAAWDILQLLVYRLPFSLDTWSTSTFLNKSEASCLGPFPVVVKIDGKDLRTKKGVEGCAGWISRSEVDESTFQELVLCSSEGRAETRHGERDGLTVLQGRLEKHRLRSRLPRKFTVLDEIREMAAEEAKGRDQVRRKFMRKCL